MLFNDGCISVIRIFPGKAKMHPLNSFADNDTSSIYVSIYLNCYRILESSEVLVQMKYGGSDEQHEGGIQRRAHKTDYGPYSGYFKIKDVDLLREQF